MRPRTLEDLALWAYYEGVGAALEPPDKLHTHSYAEGDDPGHTGREAIRGLPFTVRFLKYLEGERPQTPARRALRKMHARGARQSIEYRICHAAIEDGQSVWHTQTILRCSNDVLLRALLTLYELTESEKANERALSKPEKSVA